SIPYPYDAAFRRHVGYFNPSNIVEHEGYLYATVFATAAGAQRGGNCLLRTDRIADPRAWRAWDGRGFAVSFVDPYEEKVADPARHVCAPVGAGWPFWSLVRHRNTGAFIALMMGETPEFGAGIYYATSRNLLDWSAPRLLDPAIVPERWRCGA